MKSVEMDENHLRDIKVREMEREDMGDNFLELYGENYLSSEFKRAVLNDEGEVVFLFGGKKDANGDGWVWLLASELLHKNPIASMEMIINLHKEARAVHPEVKRYYTFNDPDFPQALRFLERLGYKQTWSTNEFPDKKERIVLVKEIL